ncbi:MAG: hypothetical protein ACI8VC_000036 [Candidatus Endobugula sp.]|jgi:hypothetical protein
MSRYRYPTDKRRYDTNQYYRLPTCQPGLFGLYISNQSFTIMKIIEEYFSADRLLELPINSVINIIADSHGVQFTVGLIGVDNGKSAIISLPSIERASNPAAYAEVISVGAAFEMQGIHDGRVIAFESTITDIYNQRLLICTFPEMIETRRLRKEIRFPCALSCDISDQGDETYGAVTNISIGLFAACP